MNSKQIAFSSFIIELQRIIRQNIHLQCVSAVDWDEINTAVECMLKQKETNFILIGASKKGEKIELIGIGYNEIRRFIKEFSSQVVKDKELSEDFFFKYAKNPKTNKYHGILYYHYYFYTGSYRYRQNRQLEFQLTNQSGNGKLPAVLRIHGLSVGTKRKNTIDPRTMKIKRAKKVIVDPLKILEPTKIEKTRICPAANGKTKKIGGKRNR